MEAHPLATPTNALVLLQTNTCGVRHGKGRRAASDESFSQSIWLLSRLNGCYEALEGGNTTEALIDFTGGVPEPLSLDREALILHSDHRRAFFQTLAKAHEHKALITCSIRVEPIFRSFFIQKRCTTQICVTYSRVCYLSASRGGGSGVAAGLRPGSRTRLRDHGSEEGEAGGAGAGLDVPPPHGAHEEPVGDHTLDGCLESGVREL